jgi:hypothetical protein
MDKARRFLSGILILNGTLGFAIGLALVVPLWADAFAVAAILGLVMAYVGATQRAEEQTHKLMASSREGLAELAGAMAEVHGLNSIECAQCQKAIDLDEWPDHVNWHRLAEGPPPRAQA